MRWSGLDLHLAVVDVRGAPPGCPARDTRDADWCERTADDCFHGGHQAVRAPGQEALAELEAEGAGRGDQDEDSNAFDHGQFTPVSLVIRKIAGSSSKSLRSPGFSFLAPAGMA